MDVPEESTKCQFCDKLIKVTYIRKHCLRFHLTDGSSFSRKPRIVCCLCKHAFNFRKQLRDHVRTHDVLVGKKLLSFDSPTKFQKWLKDEQNSLKLRFVRSRASGTKADGSKSNDYVCQYDNTHKHRLLPSDKRKRASKTKGSYKLDGSCTASIHVVEQANGETKVEYFNVHVGHDISPAHFYLNSDEKQVIAEKVKSGENFSQILSDIRSNLSDDKIRSDLVSRKTLHNIAFSLTFWKLHLIDTASVDKWIEEMKQKDYNPVCFYKRQGVAHDILKKHDFMLVIITEIQRKLLLEFGNNIICIDSTYESNPYNFQLTTMFVVDYHFESFPVAFCLSNTIRCSVTKIFFEQIRLKTGKVLAPRIFVSDDYDFYHEAWELIMGIYPTRKLLFTRHVDRSWRRNLHKISNQEGKKRLRQFNIYRKLRMLLEESNESIFLQLLGSVVTYLFSNSDTKMFGEYFKKKWLNRTEKWAYCYRIDCGVSTNIGSENLHRIMKHVYNKGSMVKRLDYCICSLMKIVKEKFFERFVKKKKGIVFLQDEIMINDVEVEVESSEYDINNSLTMEEDKDFRRVQPTTAYLNSLLNDESEVRPECSTFIKNHIDLCVDHALETEENSLEEESSSKRKPPRKFNLRKRKQVNINSVILKMPTEDRKSKINNYSYDRKYHFNSTDHLY